MGSIRILPEQLQNQIAAGEVVERPASVVKELVENAIDAQATKITVEVKKAGKESIIVSDNGCGMDEEDLKKSLTRFATSKIATQEDLNDIHTYGFRGEALASISSVSRFTITSKVQGSEPGIKLSYDPQTDSCQTEPIGCPFGTSIEVRDLFCCTPARLKFLKGDSTELHHILDTLESIILINPQIEWTFRSNDKEVFCLPALEGERNANLLAQIQRLLSIKNADDLYGLDSVSPIIEIRGYVGSPKIAKHTKKNQYLFINGRPVKNTTVSGAVLAAFKSVLPHGNYPFFVIDFEITRDLIDVNVHPRKTEIRFINSQQVFLAVKTAVEKAVQKMDRINEAVPQDFTPFRPSSPPRNDFTQELNTAPIANSSGLHHTTPQKSAYFDRQNQITSAFQPQNIQQESIEFTQNAPESVPNMPQRDHDIAAIHQPEVGDKIIGQMNNCYIIVEKEEGLLILDQHAVHERIRYEKLSQAADEQAKLGQAMLLPETVELSHSDCELLKEHRDFLQNLGFDWQLPEGNTCLITAIPSIIEDRDISDVFKGLLDDLTQLDTAGRSVDKIRERAILFLSCKKATKFGDQLSHTEMAYLYNEWNKCAKKETCPHGRALSYFIPFKQLNKTFDRTS